jgi:hypothetical protein
MAVDIADLELTGGEDGAVLTTDGSGALEWVVAPPATVVTQAPLFGDGHSDTPIGVTVATGTQVTTGTDNVNPVTSSTLAGVTGALSALDTTDQSSLVAAINELFGDLAALTEEGGDDAALTPNNIEVTSPLTGNGSSDTPLALTTVPISLGGTGATGAAAGLDALTGGATTTVGVPTRASGTPGVWTFTDISDVLRSVSVTAPITGNGTAGTPLALTMASSTNITGGSDTTNPVSSAGLRQLMGADVGTLTTTAQTVVPAINELHALIQALEGALQFVGTYDADGDVVTPAGAGTVPAGALPAASSANEGAVLIVTTAGTGSGNAPAVSMSAGDWLISTGTEWILVDLDLHSVAAANVSITSISGLSAGNVQAALAEIVAGGVTPVVTDETSIVGDGTSGDPLAVATVDAGTF